MENILEKSEATVISSKTFNVTINYLSDGSEAMRRKNDGFSAFELSGILDFILSEVKEQIKGTLTPMVVAREVVKD